MSIQNMNANYREILSLLNRHRVRYLVVGAYAVMRYAEPRYTKDIDIWIDPDLVNAERVFRAVVEFGAPLKNYTPADFGDRYSVFQIGVEPVRIDLIANVPGVRFANAWRRRNRSRIGGMAVNFISKADLIKAKEAAGRRVDLIDLDNLKGLT